MSVILGILTFVLVIVSLLLIGIVLMQKDKSGGGVGGVIGGGMAEATFGAETSNVLTKGTINLAIAFFVLSTALFLGRIYQHTHVGRGAHVLPSMTGAAPVPAFPAPAAPSNPAPAPSPKH